MITDLSEKPSMHSLRDLTITFEVLSEIRDQLIIGLTNGSLAYVNTKLSLIYDLIQMSDSDVNCLATNNLFDFPHISEDS